MAKLRVVGGMRDKLETITRDYGWASISFTGRRAPQPGDRLITVREINRKYIPGFTVAHAQAWLCDMPERVKEPRGTMLWWESEIAAGVALEPLPAVLEEYLRARAQRPRPGERQPAAPPGAGTADAVHHPRPPRDWTDHYVCRPGTPRQGGVRPGAVCRVAESLNELRQGLLDLGLARLERFPEDALVIVEVWL